MRVGRVFQAVVKVVFVVIATAAGAGGGALLGVAFATAAMPNAELEGIVPMALGTVGGSVLGAFAELLALFKVPRIQRRDVARLGGGAVVLVVLGLLGLFVSQGRTADSAWAAAAVAGLPLSLLVAITTLSSAVFGPSRAAAARHP